MSLLREIQNAAVDSDVELSVVLRKCLVLAVRLGHEQFKKWVEQELNGYDSKENLPEYRKIRAESRGDFSASFGRWFKNLPIPPSCVPEKYRELADTAYLAEGVSAYAELLKKSSGGSLRVPWPSDLTRFVGSEIYGDTLCVDAWLEISAGVLANVLDTVRNRILSFVLEIESEAPDAGEAEPGSQPVQQQHVTQMFNTYILGGASNVALGGSNFSQQQVVAGDLNSLRECLRALNVSPQDLQGLEFAVKEDGPPTGAKRLGKKVSAWVGKMTEKALLGAWKVVGSAGADVLTRAILRYYGLS